MILISMLVAVAGLVVLYQVGARWPFDPVGLFCLEFTVVYGLRMVVVALRLDPLIPTYIFGANLPVVEPNLLIALWLIVVATTFVVGRSFIHRPVSWLLPHAIAHPDPARYRRAVLVLTAASLGITLVLFETYGGFSGLLRSVKTEKELAGLYPLRVVPAIASTVATASFLDVIRRGAFRRSPSELRRLLISLGAALINGLCVFAWGARGLLVIVALAIVAGIPVFRVRRAATARRSPWMRLVLAGLAALGLVVGLRVTRDVVLHGEVQEAIAGESIIRQISIASNANSYDATVLAVRDWPSANELRGGEDFVNGLAGVVPRAIWSDKPETVAPGSWFRRYYEPTVANGWPMQAVGEWYLNFGYAGILIGGAVSGLLLVVASRTMTRTREEPFAFVTAIVIMTQVMPAGFHAQLPLRWVQWVLPILLIGWYLRAFRVPRRAPASGTEPDRALLTGEPS